MAAPRKKTDAFRVLETNLGRSEAFLRHFDGDGRTRGTPSRDEVELLRGAVVFAVGALDAFVHDLILELVPKFSIQSKELDSALTQIAKEQPGLALQMSLLKKQDEVQQAFREALDRWLSEKAFQGPEKVMRGLLFIGVAPEGGFDGLGGEGAAKKLKAWTEMRHQIVHRGAEPKVKRAEAAACIGVVRSIGEAVNKIAVEKHYAKKKKA